jgi:hypothetical protein
METKVLIYTLNNELLFHMATSSVLLQYDAHKPQMPCFYEILTLYSYFPIDLNSRINHLNSILQNIF